MSCGKTRYASGAQARRALDNIRRFGEHRDKVPLRPYPCPYCNGWHLTSEPVAGEDDGRRRRR